MNYDDYSNFHVIACCREKTLKSPVSGAGKSAAGAKEEARIAAAVRASFMS